MLIGQGYRGSVRMGAREADVVMVLLDDSRAHAPDEMKRTLFAESPEEHPENHKDRVCSLLCHLHGVRDASQLFELRVQGAR